MGTKKLRRRNFWDWEQVLELQLVHLEDLKSTFQKCKVHKDHKPEIRDIDEYVACMRRVMRDRYFDELEKKWPAYIKKLHKEWLKKPLERNGDGHFRLKEQLTPLQKIHRKTSRNSEALAEKDWNRANEIFHKKSREWWC